MTKIGSFIVESLLDPLKRLSTNITQGLSNLLYFLPKIWKFRNYDWAFSAELFAHALKALHEGIERGVGVTPRSHKRRLTSLINALQRLQDDNYCELEQRKHAAKWGEVIFRRDPTTGYIVLTNEKVLTKEDSLKEITDRVKIFNHEEYLRKQDIELISKNIKYLTHWWD
jgi:hypothetical protein